ncbi:MAG: hypothetical protein ACT4QF_04550 [Sporichthyaceae bacterium]
MTTRPRQSRSYLVVGLTATVSLALTGCGGMPGMDHSKASDVENSSMAGMSNEEHAQMVKEAEASGDGRVATKNGYTLAAVKGPGGAGRAGELSFKIVNPRGDVQQDFVLELTKLMHVYVVRKDMSSYYHLHPDKGADGTWRVPLTVARPGPYRVVAEFDALTPDGEFAARRLGEDLTVPGTYSPVDLAKLNDGTASSYLGADGDVQEVRLADVGPGGARNGEFALAMEGEALAAGKPLALRFIRNGQELKAMEPYLDAFAHITGFRKTDLKTVHIHPSTAPPKGDQNARGGPKLELAAPQFSEPGEYRLFVQFRVDGAVHTIPINVSVG